MSVLTGTSAYGVVHTNGTVRVGSYTDGSAGYLGTHTNHPFGVLMNNSAVAYFGTNGNLCVGGTASVSDKLTVEGNIAVSVAGNGLEIKEGSNARMGVATLVAGSVVVNNTSVTANSRIILTIQSLGTVATPMPIAVTARTASTSFTITSSDGTDTSVIAWMIVEPN